MNVFNQKADTIVALCTPQGIGAIAIVRLSGSKAIDIAQQIVKPFPKTARTMTKCIVTTDELVDEAMCAYFSEPHSFSGEDTVEFYLHGGVTVSGCVINKCIILGARLASNGEFSKRAFINGKLNLTNAEGMIDIINAESSLAARNGHLLLINELMNSLNPTLKVLIDLSATMEAAIDYPDENIELDKPHTIKLIHRCLENVNYLLATQRQGGYITKGVNIVIAGQTNVGKSSLLNSLIEADRVIVSDIEGTTRDTVEVSKYINGIKFNFIDTAGIRQTIDSLEALGIERTKKAIDMADILLIVSDVYPLSEADQKLLMLNKKHLVVLNKCDINNYQTQENYINISAKYNIGISQLKQQIFNLIKNDIATNDEIVLTNARHIDLLNRCSLSLNNVTEHIDSTYDIILLYLKEALDCLNELDGSNSTQQVIDEVFSKFCIGK